MRVEDEVGNAVTDVRAINFVNDPLVADKTVVTKTGDNEVTIDRILA